MIGCGSGVEARSLEFKLKACVPCQPATQVELWWITTCPRGAGTKQHRSVWYQDRSGWFENALVVLALRIRPCLVQKLNRRFVNLPFQAGELPSS